MVRILFTLALLALSAAHVNASPPAIKLTLADGTVLRGTLANESIALQTAYGQLQIPVSDIRAIHFAMHLSPADQKAISQAVRGLGSEVHRERELSTKLLRSMGKKSVPALRAYASPFERANAPGKDIEQYTRACELIYEIASNDPTVDTMRENDMIDTREFSAKGKITTEMLTIKSATLGELAVRLPDMQHMAFRSFGTFGSRVYAEFNGSSLDTWLDTKLDVTSEDKIAIRATGAVELWPQTPGQYTAGPKGYNTIGRGGLFNAGALVGKIGANGKMFFIGERYDGHADMKESGRLMLLIIPSPWNNVSAGHYDVTVNVGD